MRAPGAMALVLLLAACPAQKSAPPPPARDGKLGKQRCSSLPGNQNPRLPVLQRPFDLNYPVLFLFDHLTPLEYRGYNAGSKELTYCGLDMLGLPEGHEGYTWSLPVGTPVFPAADGEVTAAGIEADFFCPLTKQMVSGQMIVELKHEELGGVGFVTTYRHLSKVLVKTGDVLQASQRLGLSGQTGCAQEPQLNFAVKRLTGTRTGRPTVVDPYGWDGPTEDPWAKDPAGSASLYLWKDGQAPTLSGRE